MFNVEKEGQEEPEKEEASDDDDDDDIEAALDREKAQVSKKEKPVDRRFQLVDSGVQNLLFIRTTVTDPVHLATSITRNILE